ncbi:flagellar protein FlhE [Erwinia sp. OLTSP20]|uniref:flagellar protein FlhE n=1 Tax=unclassified Erwinia TaxID=2622719 RepID=UPI000C559D07|nr:flagellar protein FlhE [Erwinia sp. OAMSP11]PIJ75980.1 flagellar protein FlhE [Erwinia sp. OLSSP12]PIJ83643.1 flagellar protein FlhE [Erwinia sp. OLCASP19]PIJ87500.1 flagellar protein FlhE [Erwinia sp. OLMTSP26]PIJ89049.1 flagellar protein FlhE [Erwinia sp. OLMDSP33]PIJ93857.1 flagellar protein FlhE [Erwinia sp. OLTSP20]PIJ94272.1 flagellar protein FlhE [Erwinia sp. OLFS4]
MLSVVMLLPAPGLAASGGAWQSSAIGPALDNRGVAAASRPLAPPHRMKGTMTIIWWRYQLTAPAPADLVVRLCSTTRCVTLEGQRGETRGLTNVPAGETLHFVYLVPGSGRLWPTLRVRSNEVMVNYAR